VKAAAWLILPLTLAAAPLHAVAADDAAVEAMQEYLEFAEATAGVILPEQLTEDVFSEIFFVDARDPSQFEEQTIPGAVNIEWRQVLARRSELPRDRKVVLFCNTGARSAQATFALRVAGMGNVVVLQSGIEGWLESAPYKPE